MKATATAVIRTALDGAWRRPASIASQTQTAKARTRRVRGPASACATPACPTTSARTTHNAPTRTSAGWDNAAQHSPARPTTHVSQPRAAQRDVVSRCVERAAFSAPTAQASSASGVAALTIAPVTATHPAPRVRSALGHEILNWVVCVSSTAAEPRRQLCPRHRHARNPLSSSEPQRHAAVTTAIHFRRNRPAAASLQVAVNTLSSA